jgi:hypothetical protein
MNSAFNGEANNFITGQQKIKEEAAIYTLTM